MAKRRGKYAHITDKLPRMSLITPNRELAVETITAQILKPEDLLTVLQSHDSDESIIDLLKEIEDRIKIINMRLIAMPKGKRWASEFAKAYAELRMVRAKIGEFDTSLSVTLEAFSELMVIQMEVEGIASVRLASGQPVSTYREPYSQVEDREKYRQWCIKQGLERQMHLAWQTTNNLVKQMLMAGDPEPPGITVWSKPRIRLGEGDL